VRRVGLALMLVIHGELVGAGWNQVSYERISASAAEPGNWLTYSGNYQGHRFSELSQINTSNVGQLRPAWVYQMEDPSRFETSPIAIDGTLYITERPHVVTALDGKTGQVVWSYQGRRSRGGGCCGRVSRGVAALDDALYVATFDAHIISLDRRTGTARWDRTFADIRQGYSSTAAPLALRDKIIVGVAGGDMGARGFLSAFSKGGKELWRFWTVPGP